MLWKVSGASLNVECGCYKGHGSVWRGFRCGLVGDREVGGGVFDGDEAVGEWGWC